jgi:hypothetical protein
VLPLRYRTRKIHWRGQCGVPASWLHDEHLQVLSQLKNTHATLEELSVRTQILPSDMARYLSALYYAGAVTADERRAQRSSERSPVGQQSSLPPTLGGPTAPPSVLGDLDVRRDPLDTTAPARLI